MTFYILINLILSNKQHNWIINKEIHFLDNTDINYITDVENSQRLQYDEDICVYRCSFTSLMPSMGGGGGAIFITKLFLIINCTFTNCKATTGGAIYSRRSKHSTIKKSKI